MLATARNRRWVSRIAHHGSELRLSIWVAAAAPCTGGGRIRWVGATGRTDQPTPRHFPSRPRRPP